MTLYDITWKREKNYDDKDICRGSWTDESVTYIITDDEPTYPALSYLLG